MKNCEPLQSFGQGNNNNTTTNENDNNGRCSNDNLDTNVYSSDNINDIISNNIRHIPSRCSPLRGGEGTVD